MLEALLVERGARQPFEPHDSAGARSHESRRPPRPADVHDRSRTRRRTSTTRSRFAARRTGFARGCTSPTSRSSSRAGTPLDRGASQRAFSTYVPGKVAPMLPHELADDLCSLRPHVDRLCVTVEIPPQRRAAVLPLGDPLGRAAHLRRGASAARRRRRSSTQLELNDELALGAARQALRARRAAGADARGRLSLRRQGRRRRGMARGRAARAHARRGADDPRERARRRVPLVAQPRVALPRARAARSEGGRAPAREARRPRRADAARARSG